MTLPAVAAEISLKISIKTFLVNALLFKEMKYTSLSFPVNVLCLKSNSSLNDFSIIASIYSIKEVAFPALSLIDQAG